MIYTSKIWLNDIDKVISVLPELEMMEGDSVLITGAGGLICSAVADIFIRYNENHDKKINILLAGRSEKRLTERFGKYIDGKVVQFISYDATTRNPLLPTDIEYIIHGAGNAYPSMIIMEPVETMVSNFNGLMNLLNYAKENNTKRVLYISSSEVYGQKKSDKPARECDYGYIDLLNSRNSYSIGKRAAETLCVSYSDEYSVETVIIRPGHVYGPTASVTDNRVSSIWAHTAARGENIVMKSDGSQIRSYCYCLDCASAIIKVLLRGKNRHAYNISNPDSVISIKQMAGILTKCADVRLRIELPTEEEKKGFNPMSNSSLDAAELLSLGWHCCFDAEVGFAHTVQIIKETLC